MMRSIALPLILLTVFAWASGVFADEGSDDAGQIFPAGFSVRADDTANAGGADERLIELGKALFFDPTLSRRRSQSCASCHDPDLAYSDAGNAVSIGDDGSSLGDRNSPALTYAAMIPSFRRTAAGTHVGGFFLDGRAVTLAHQVAEPLTNTLEMNQPDLNAVAVRIRENDDYLRQFREIFGDAVMDDDAQLVTAMTAAVVAFERSEELSSFDSRYDRYLLGEATLSYDESMGRELFFSQLTNCATCHLKNSGKLSNREPFTNHEYHNIGIPANLKVREANGLGDGHVDPGLFGNPGVHAGEMVGKYRVPTLRNVAVTGPYMHNGVFERLETAVLYYGRFTLANARSKINPETGRQWRAAEVGHTIDTELLSQGQPLDATRAGFLTAFLKTLTDRRYEHLLE